MDSRDEIARKAALHGGWVGETILGLLEEIERLEEALRDATDEKGSKEVGAGGE